MFVVEVWKERNPAINLDITGFLTCVITVYLAYQQASTGCPLCAKQGIFQPELLMNSTCQSSSNSD